MSFCNLVFEGGGVKGIAYGGALEILDNKGVLGDIRRVAGTSAGAITAVLLAVGYSHEEVSEIVAGTSFKDFADDSFGIVRDANRFVRNFGWHKGDYFRKWIGRLIRRKTGNKNLTFSELTERDGSLELYLTGTNLSDQTTEIYSHEHTPDLAIRDGARMSMSIPLYFRCVREGPDRDVIVDGGVAWNYPINIFDNEKYLINAGNGEAVDYNDSPGYVFNHETLGFRLDSRQEIAFNERNWANVPKEIDDILEYAMALIGFMHETANKKHLHNNDWNRSIFIDTRDVKTTDFDLSDVKIAELLDSGREGVTAYFDWRDNAEEMNLPV